MKSIIKVLSKKGKGIVYGGGNVGLMGEIATIALKEDMEVIGVIPKFIYDKISNIPLTKLYSTQSLHERKHLMFHLSDAFIALPGGLGTIDEFFEILTWSQLGLHRKPMGIFNCCNYFDNLLKFLDFALDEGFIKKEHRDMIITDNSAVTLLEKLKKYNFKYVSKWVGIEENNTKIIP